MVWSLSGNQALVRTPDISAAMQLDHPTQGLGHCAVDGQTLAEAVWLAVDMSGRPADDPPVDAYVRGTDLVVQYPPRSGDLVSHQIYYRVHEQPSGIELVLSVQTSLLESAPETQVACRGIGPGESWVKLSDQTRCVCATGRWSSRDPSRPEFFLLRPHAKPFSFITLVHPRDFSVANAFDGEDMQVSFTVFPDSLEKGVIRRASFQWRVVPREQDEQWAAEVFEQVTAAAPTLTT